MQAKAAADGGLAEFDVASGGVIDPGRPAELVRGRADHLNAQLPLDLRFDAIIELVAVAVEELDALSP